MSNSKLYNLKSSLPNKLLQDDGKITDMFGNTVTNAVDAYNSKPALPNKFLNPDGTYSTLNEIIAGSVDTDIFIVVDELPDEGIDNKIYLVPSTDFPGEFDEFYWNGTAFDKIGRFNLDLSDYSTTEQVQALIDTAIQTSITSVLGGDY